VKLYLYCFFNPQHYIQVTGQLHTLLDLLLVHVG